MTVGYAHRIYPNNFNFALDKEKLRNLPKKDRYATHTSIHAERLHWVVEKITLVPFRICLKAYSWISMPCPGEGKDMPLWQQRAIRVGSCFLFIITLPFALASLIISMPLRAIEHGYRPLFQYFRREGIADKIVQLSHNKALHVRTANLSLTPSSWVNISNDMREPCQRAYEIAHSINVNPQSPDIILLQETWNEDAAKVFMTTVSSTYPHIIHSICPQIGGMDSGYMVVSKVPIEGLRFQRFADMTWQHSMPPRGILEIDIATSGGGVTLYNIHTQSMFGAKQARVRMNQIDQIARVVQEGRNPHQIIMGDFNTSRNNEWGEVDPHEGPVVTLLDQRFLDHYKRSHNNDGKHKNPQFLQIDNGLMGVDLPYPTSSFVYGAIDNEKGGRENYFGRRGYFERQPFNQGCFLDRILTPNNSTLRIDVELRRIAYGKKGVLEFQSPPSDHTFLDGLVYLQENQRDDKKD